MFAGDQKISTSAALCYCRSGQLLWGANELLVCVVAPGVVARGDRQVRSIQRHPWGGSHLPRSYLQSCSKVGLRPAGRNCGRQGAPFLIPLAGRNQTQLLQRTWLADLSYSARTLGWLGHPAPTTHNDEADPRVDSTPCCCKTAGAAGSTMQAFAKAFCECHSRAAGEPIPSRACTVGDDGGGRRHHDYCPPSV